VHEALMPVVGSKRGQTVAADKREQLGQLTQPHS
jgi:hypothetical protein